MSTPRLPLVPLAILAAALLGACGEDTNIDDSGAAIAGNSQPGQVRTYYLAAEEQVWDYAPTGANQVTGEPFDEEARVFTANGPDRIGTRYLKALYVEYTDAGFTTVKPRAP